MIRLFIIEDHLTVIVSSFRFLFRPERDGIRVAGFAATVEEAVKSADPATFDLVILDLHIPGHRPLDNIRMVRKFFPGKPVAIYTAEASSSWRNKMIEEGAITYITKDVSREELKTAIQKAARGEIYYFGQIDAVEEKSEGESQDPPRPELTPVQKQIIGLLAEGLTHKDISSRTGLSRSLIEKILNALRASLNVKNNVELVRVLTKKGAV
ncbi:MAG: response regulator transcription factor [Bacteroidota bacterium]